jgi:hypothetical protein
MESVVHYDLYKNTPVDSMPSHMKLFFASSGPVSARFIILFTHLCLHLASGLVYSGISTEN